MADDNVIDKALRIYPTVKQTLDNLIISNSILMDETEATMDRLAKLWGLAGDDGASKTFGHLKNAHTNLEQLRTSLRQAQMDAGLANLAFKAAGNK